MSKFRTLERVNDVRPLTNLKPIKTYINGQESIAYEGETVLSILIAHNMKEISKNDHDQEIGPYCGMGICYCCMVVVDKHKKRACKTIVQEGMVINTLMNTKDIVNKYHSTE